jgi:hypothetical protein
MFGSEPRIIREIPPAQFGFATSSEIIKVGQTGMSGTTGASDYRSLERLGRIEVVRASS